MAAWRDRRLEEVRLFKMEKQRKQEEKRHLELLEVHKDKLQAETRLLAEREKNKRVEEARHLRERELDRKLRELPPLKSLLMLAEFKAHMAVLFRPDDKPETNGQRECQASNGYRCQIVRYVELTGTSTREPISVPWIMDSKACPMLAGTFCRDQKPKSARELLGLIDTFSSDK